MGSIDGAGRSSLLHVALTRDESCAASARRYVRDAIGAHVSERALERAILSVSELVTNAWKHGKGTIELKVLRGSQAVRVEVIDQGSGVTPQIRKKPGDETGGWGLRIVDELAVQWGCFEGTTHVWADLPLG